jgi:ABC-type sugar transport system substrate-binding protein
VRLHRDARQVPWQPGLDCVYDRMVGFRRSGQLERGRCRGAVHESGRRLRRAGLLGVLAWSVVGCGGDHASTTRSQDLAAVVEALDDPFIRTMRDGLQTTARDRRLRIDLEAPVGVQDTTGQASALESLAMTRAACYVLNPIDRANLVPSLPAIARGTPIVNIESPIDRGAAKAVNRQIDTYIGTDNRAAGRLAADAMATVVRSGAQVAVIAGIPGDVGSAALTQRFIEGARGRFEVVQTIAADFDRTQAEVAARRLLRKGSPVDGVFAVSDQMALGVVDALRAAGRTNSVPVVGMDGIAEALTAVRNGDMSATIARYPYTIGQLGVEACAAAIRQKTLPETVHSPIQLVTRQNVARVQLRMPRPLGQFHDPLLPLLND